MSTLLHPGVLGTVDLHWNGKKESGSHPQKANVLSFQSPITLSLLSSNCSWLFVSFFQTLHSSKSKFDRPRWDQMSSHPKRAGQSCKAIATAAPLPRAGAIPGKGCCWAVGEAPPAPLGPGS